MRAKITETYVEQKFTYINFNEDWKLQHFKWYFYYLDSSLGNLYFSYESLAVVPSRQLSFLVMQISYFFYPAFVSLTIFPFAAHSIHLSVLFSQTVLPVDMYSYNFCVENRDAMLVCNYSRILNFFSVLQFVLVSIIVKNAVFHLMPSVLYFSLIIFVLFTFYVCFKGNIFLLSSSQENHCKYIHFVHFSTRYLLTFSFLLSWGFTISYNFIIKH